MRRRQRPRANAVLQMPQGQTAGMWRRAHGGGRGQAAQLKASRSAAPWHDMPCLPCLLTCHT